MFDCSNLLHPFQNDPGVSQRQRIMDNLLSGSAKIDGRSMADLLDYFVQLSRHINYYNTDLSISDWQPFFKKSLPFSLAAMIKYNRDAVTKEVEDFAEAFHKHPSPSGLQLLIHYIFFQLIDRINTWHLQLQDSSLLAELILVKLIKDKLQTPVARFVCYHNVAAKEYCIKPLNFLPLFQNEVWGLDINKLYANDCSPEEKTRRKRLIALYDNVKNLLPSFLDSIRIIADTAEQSMEQSFFPLKEELQERHTPHLALLFAFLKLYQHLQDDLNSFTKKHLDFFYKEVLKLQAKEAVPDKVHLVFEIQKQLDKYLLKKGLLVKDGKDNNKAEILFSLDDEIVVNKTQVADKRTLFLNNRNVFEQSYLEGVYVVPDAGKADGVLKEFKDNEPKSFPTLGAKLSKYKDPEKGFTKPYPNARLGFILASPVLLLNEGRRNITLKLACKLDNLCEDDKYPHLFLPEKLYKKVKYLAGKIFHVISQDLILEAIKKGIKEATSKKLWDFLKTDTKKMCGQEINVYQQQITVTAGKWRNEFFNALSEDEKEIIGEIFKPRRIFKILLSGKEAWIEPSHIKKFKFQHYDPGNNTFVIKIRLILKSDKEAVTFYDKDKLKEDFNTSLPLVKIELDDTLKILRGTNLPTRECCLDKFISNEKRPISFYHFFRQVQIEDKINADETKIEVRVCGLKNVVVQNDESVQDVNAPIYPFGTRPKINSSFYIGCEEIFLKKWSNLFVNINWKDLPLSPPASDPLHGKPFQYYYNGYQDFLINSGVEINTVLDNKFRIQIAVLQDGVWEQWKYNENCIGAGDPKCQLFQLNPLSSFCNTDKGFTHQFQIDRFADYTGTGLPFPSEKWAYKGFSRLNTDTRQGFLRITLKCQDFQHDKYPFILARQMTALGKLPKIVDGAVYYGVVLGGPLPQFTTIDMPVILKEIVDNYNLSLNPNLLTNLEGLIDEINVLANPPQNISSNVWSKLFIIDDPSTLVPNDAPPFTSPQIPFLNPENHSDYYVTLKAILDWLKGLKEKVENFKDKGVVIPNEPWTPIIKNMSLDYTATASITDAINDIDLIHLYPYENTYKHEEITLQPTLFPTFCDEGTLFVGLKDLEPGSNLNILFQLAEATADSESEREEVSWHYLDNNQWKILREGFEILNDATEGLTTSGIIKFALPENMTKENTILPKGLHWIKASIPKNSGAVCETIGIHTQAISSTFTNETANDKLRLARPLATGAITKLKEADAKVKRLLQPYDSYGGRVPEAEGHFYVRVSELLQHKGRAIQKFDYERLALEAFPQLFKVKCINHSFALNAHQYKNDFPLAPGYIILAVIPDLNQLKAAQSFEPRVPVSLLEDIEDYIKRCTSPFVKCRAMNPRYEKINFCIKAKLLPGKDENYYKEKLKQDIKEFLAPWSIGKYDKLSFGQCVSRSDIIRLLETSDYVDFISGLCMVHEEDNEKCSDLLKTNKTIVSVCPKTPRSILIAGDIDVCIPERDCEDWDEKKKCENKAIPIADYCPEIIIH